MYEGRPVRRCRTGLSDFREHFLKSPGRFGADSVAVPGRNRTAYAALDTVMIRKFCRDSSCFRDRSRMHSVSERFRSEPELLPGRGFVKMRISCRTGANCMKRTLAVLVAAAMLLGMTACGSNSDSAQVSETGEPAQVSADSEAETGSAETESAGAESAGEPSPEPDAEAEPMQADTAAEVVSDRDYIETTLNLANNTEYTWRYQSGAWTMSVVSAVAFPEIADEEGVSVSVPGAYVTGIDTDGDGLADVTADTFSEAVNGALVIDYEASVTSTNGQIYTAATAPVILNTGAAGYSSSANTEASSTYASEGYINVACGNRGKQDTVQDADGNIRYTGDAPSCLADQKAAARFVKYNILLGNLPGCADYLISTGGSGGGAHAVMFAATSNNPDFYPYQEEVGAVGVYLREDGSYITTVSVDGEEVSLSDGAWGCIAYSAITPLYEGDIAMAFEYSLDTGYSFGSAFQAQLAEYLAEAYMDYINTQNLQVREEDVGFDLDGDGALTSTVSLSITYDETLYPDTNGYGGTYLDLYLAEFVSNLQWYLDNLDYAEGWTWFDSDGNPLSDAEVAAMTSADRAEAFLEGRCAAASSEGMGGLPSGMNGAMDFPDSDLNSSADGPDNAADGPGGLAAGEIGSPGCSDGADGPADLPETGKMSSVPNENADTAGDRMDAGTPDAGTTQAAGSSIDSQNYGSYEEMAASYAADIAEILAGDAYGNNPVSLYNPLNYIGADDTEAPVWTRIMMGAAEGDMSMLNSLNLQIAWLNAGTDCDIEWQWDGGHVPSEIFSSSFSLYVDEMYAAYAGGTAVSEPEAVPQTENGTAESPTGTDISSWVDSTDPENVSFSLAAAAAYRTAGASKAIPGFDVIDYGQEDYVFGSPVQDARHWDIFLLDILETHADTLAPLFNAG